MIRLATDEDLPRLVETLTSAFSTYVWTRWTIPSDQFSERLSELQSIYIQHFAIPHGMVYVNDDSTAVAAFVPSDMPAPPQQIQERIAALHGDRLPLIAEADLLLESKRPQHDWILAAAAVDPKYQRQGLGQKVCAAGLHRIAGDGQSCLLETSNPTNVAFYRRLGFEVIEEINTRGPKIWIMATQPAKLSETSGGQELTSAS